MNDTTNDETSKIMGILSLVFGLIAIAVCWISMGMILVYIFGIAGVALGVVTISRICKNSSETRLKNMAIAGVVLCGIAIVLIIILPTVFGLCGIQLPNTNHPGGPGQQQGIQGQMNGQGSPQQQGWGVSQGEKQMSSGQGPQQGGSQGNQRMSGPQDDPNQMNGQGPLGNQGQLNNQNASKMDGQNGQVNQAQNGQGTIPSTTTIISPDTTTSSIATTNAKQ
jgi:hypothetical protein